MKKDELYIRTSVSWPPAIDRWFRRRAKKFGMTVSAYIVQLGVEDMKSSERHDTQRQEYPQGRAINNKRRHYAKLNINSLAALEAQPRRGTKLSGTCIVVRQPGL